MKKAMYIIPFFLFIFLSCNNDDDSGSSDTIASKDILGTWELKHIEDPESKIIRTPPEDASTSIKITFSEDGFSGNTETNSFMGNYSVASEKLSVQGMASTFVAETEWGLRFIEAFNNENMPIKIEGNVLIIEDKNSAFIHLIAQ